MVKQVKVVRFAPPKRVVFNAHESTTDCKRRRPTDFLFNGGLLETKMHPDQVIRVALNELGADPENAFERAWYGLRNADRAVVFKGNQKERTDFVIAMIRALSESNNTCAGRVLVGAIKKYRDEETIQRELSHAIANIGLNIHLCALQVIWGASQHAEIPEKYREDFEIFLGRYPEVTWQNLVL